jgi:hypothetical protein
MELKLDSTLVAAITKLAPELGLSPEDLALGVLRSGLGLYAGRAGRGGLPPVRKIRDLSLAPLLPGLSLVVACDSDGGIGPKEHDHVKVTAYHIGRFGTRVPLMEFLSAGAEPLLVVDTLSVEMDPTGREIIQGVADEAAAAGLDPSSMITGSTEDNVPTTATGIGVTVIGLARDADLRPGRARAGDLVVCVGTPKSGPEDIITLEDGDIMDLPSIRVLTGLSYVGDILPVGSHGVGYEANEMARLAGLTFVPDPDPRIRLTKSGGPGTCALVSLAPEHRNSLLADAPRPCYLVGRLEHGRHE